MVKRKSEEDNKYPKKIRMEGCIEDGCKENAHFGLENGVRIHCLMHKNNEEIFKPYLAEKYCITDGCYNRPIYGKHGGPAIHCYEHRIEKDILKKRYIICEYANCLTQASFGEGDRPVHCSKHRMDKERYIYNKFCINDNCGKVASYGPKDTKKRIHCLEHKKDDEIYLVQRMCIMEGCKHRARYGYEMKTHCTEHSLQDQNDFKKLKQI